MAEPENPYQPPLAKLSPSRPKDAPIFPGQREREQQISRGSIAGYISAAFTLLFVVIGLADKDQQGQALWTLIDVGLIAGLAFGVSRKSRVCAVLLMLYFLLNKYFIYEQTGSLGLPLSLLMVYFFAQGIQGTFGWHKDLREAERGVDAGG